MSADTLALHTTTDLLARIEDALDGIRPWLIADGGNVKVIELTETGTLRLELLGACSNCRMSAMTMKAGVEEAIQRAVPEVHHVEAINMTT